MRWNCPHCGVNLAMNDEKMNPSWSFSRCYQCGGYALVRRSEVNIIKVDRAPAGEKVILPEASENPMMNEAATRNLNRLTGNPNGSATNPKSNSASQSQGMSASAATTSQSGATKASSGKNEKPVIKPATRRNSSPGMQNPLRSHSASAPGMEVIEAKDPSQFQAQFQAPFQANAETTVPTQLYAPATHDSGMRPLAGPNAPAGASVDRSALPAYFNGVNNSGLFPEPLPEVPAQATRIRLLPMAIGIAAAFALGSGLYLLLQSGELIEKSRPKLSNRRPSTLDSSAVSESPRHIDEPTVAQANKANAAPVAPSQAPTQTLAMAQAQVPGHTASHASPYSDQVRSKAMAPERQIQTQVAHQPAPIAPQPVQLSSENPPLIVQAKAKNIHLRSGPGMVYPVVGNADMKTKYIVTDWNDRWFKVLPQTPAGPSPAEEIAGWIRTDSVQVIPAANSTVTE